MVKAIAARGGIARFSDPSQQTAPMAQPPAPAATAPPRRLWRTPLVVGICLGLGYGITNRLLALQWPGFVQLGQSFDVRPFPGTSLESLRQRFGAEGQAIRGDLDLIELEAQNRKEEEQARLQAEQALKRLEAAEEPPEPALPAEREPAPAPAVPAAAAPVAPAAPAPPQLPLPLAPSP
jgi:hypothetical protein